MQYASRLGICCQNGPVPSHPGFDFKRSFFLVCRSVDIFCCSNASEKNVKGNHKNRRVGYNAATITINRFIPHVHRIMIFVID